MDFLDFLGPLYRGVTVYCTYKFHRKKVTSTTSIRHKNFRHFHASTAIDQNLLGLTDEPSELNVICRVEIIHLGKKTVFFV